MKQENKHKRAIVTFASERGNYMKGLARLSDSLRNNFDGDLVAFTNELSIGCEPHSVNPYAFKIAAIQSALDAGYEQILWLDCSVYAVGNLEPIFDIIDTQGYIMQDAGHMVGNWTNDFTLNYFKISREQAMSMRCYGNAGFLGLNFRNAQADYFFHQWDLSMRAGCFKGEWKNDKFTESEDSGVMGHRHDLSAGSIIANKEGMEYVASDQFLHYGASEYDKPLNDTIILKAQGL